MVYRWRLYKYRNQFTEVWDSLESPWESQSKSKPPGELQYAVEDVLPEAIVRLRNWAAKTHKVTQKNSAVWTNLPKDDGEVLNVLRNQV